MKYKIRFACHIATLVTGLLLISGCTWQIPEGITVTGTPNYQLPAGSTTLDVGQMLQLDSMLGSFDGSESITINQADVISDFGLPTVIFNNVPEPGPAAEQVSFDDGGTADPQEFEAILVPPGIDPIDKFTEVEFESGTLNIELTFAGLSGGVSVEVSAMRIVDPADSYNVLATANEATQTYTQATPTRTYSFD
ncbi:MAG: hypothetical protein D6B26_04685, partial [Spirochaetaceae bacterium]